MKILVGDRIFVNNNIRNIIQYDKDGLQR